MRVFQIIFLVFIFSSCSTVYFQEPQPQDVEPLTTFPERVIGTYKVDLIDTLIIEKDRYSLPEKHENSYSLAQIDSSPVLEIKDNLFYDGNISYTEGISYDIKNDTLHYVKIVRKYTFLSDSLVIKSFKKYLVVSAKENKNGYWSIFILEPKGDDFVMNVVGNIKSEVDSTPADESDLMLKDFEKITRFEKIGENNYLVNPSKSEFNKLINKGLFSSPLEMKRVSDGE